MENYGRMRKNAPKETNSMNKFVSEFSHLKNEGDFLQAHDMLASNTSLSKLSLKRPAPQQNRLAPIFEKDNYAKRKPKPPTTTYQLLPVPLPKKPVPVVKSQTVTSTQSKVETTTNPARQMQFITGGVQFVLKTFKLHPSLSAMYEVYGNIMKMHKGKIQCEHIILIRRESGPVLQGFYFDFSNWLARFRVGSSIRCVGQFTRQDRFRIHKIENLPTPPPETVLTRIENISAFALIQAQNETPL